MVGPKHLKTSPVEKAPNQPAITEDLLKLLAAMQDGSYCSEYFFEYYAGFMNIYTSNIAITLM
jgi:hypothetical protein